MKSGYFTFCRENAKNLIKTVYGVIDLNVYGCRYKNELSEEDKENLKRLMRKHKHYLVSVAFRANK